jgi:hypothetical protein
MPISYFVSTLSETGHRKSPQAYPTVEEALSNASDLLSGGADEIHIVDHDGNLILPHDQVVLRLKPSTPHVSKGPARHL